MENQKYRRLFPSKRRRKSPSPYDVKKKLENFDPAKVLEQYAAQDPRHARQIERGFANGSGAPSAKDIYEVEHFVETQAERVIKKFGGVSNLIRAFTKIGRPKSRSTLYRWIYTRERGGTGGVIPTGVWPELFLAARMEGVYLSPEDIDARSQEIKRFTTIAKVSDGQIMPFIHSPDAKILEEHLEKKRARAEKRRLRTLARREKRKQELKNKSASTTTKSPIPAESKKAAPRHDAKRTESNSVDVDALKFILKKRGENT